MRGLRGVIEREKAAIAALITLREATKPMLTEAASRLISISRKISPSNFPHRDSEKL